MEGKGFSSWTAPGIKSLQLSIFIIILPREIDTMHNAGDDNMARKVLTDYNTFGNRIINLISLNSGTYS